MEEICLEFVQLDIFSRKLDAIDEPDLLITIEEALIKAPDTGVLLRGGIRKMRVRSIASGRGTRGGYRVWHYFYRQDEKIFLLYLLDKREAPNITSRMERLLVKSLQKLIIGKRGG